MKQNQSTSSNRSGRSTKRSSSKSMSAKRSCRSSAPKKTKKSVSSRSVPKRSSSEAPTQNTTQNTRNATQNGKQHTLFTGVYMNEYMEEVLKPVNDPYRGKCKYCHAGGKTKEIGIWAEGLHTHFKNKSHKTKTPDNEQEKLQKAILDLNNHLAGSEQDDEKKADQNAKAYLKFLSFCFAENYSFSQISNLGTFLQGLMKNEGLNFLKSQNIDREEVSKISNECFGEIFLNDLRKDLEKYKYSFTIDSSTLHNDSICAMTVKYAKVEEDGTFSIQNKLIGIERLEDSSTGETLFEIIKKKLFVNQTVQKNFLGWAHDNAKNLSGAYKGVLKFLKQENQNNYHFDLRDPCHGLNLTMEHSMKELPKEYMDFIENVHEYFSYPQRIAGLLNLQAKKQLPQKRLIKYVDTRWLSLGESFKRLLDIWESLKIYFDEKLEHHKNKIKEKKTKKPTLNQSKIEKLEKFCKTFNNEKFYLHLIFLSSIISKINDSNQFFQS